MMAFLIGYPQRTLCKLRALYPERPAPGGGTLTNLAGDQAVMLLEMPNGALGAVTASKITTGAEDERSVRNLRRPRRDPLAADGGRLSGFYERAAGGGAGRRARLPPYRHHRALPRARLACRPRTAWAGTGRTCTATSASPGVASTAARPQPDVLGLAHLQRLMDAMVSSHRQGAWVELTDR